MDKASLRKEFLRNGYTVLRRFFSPEEMSALMAEIHAVNEDDTSNNLNKGALVFHSTLFARSEKVKAFISQPRIVELLTNIIGADFWVRWDQAVAKGPGAGTFPWHQDNGYTNLKDPHYQLWVALTPMTAENGGLWLQPQNHFRFLPHKVVDNHAVYKGEPESPIFIEAQPGDVVLFSSYTLHSTTPNISQDTRWAYVIEYMSINHYDPTLEPPYLVISQEGKSKPEFVLSYKGSRSKRNRLKYVGRDFSLRQFVPDWVKDVKKRLLSPTPSEQMPS